MLAELVDPATVGAGQAHGDHRFDGVAEFPAVHPSGEATQDAPRQQ